jgi:hypothetical protein
MRLLFLVAAVLVVAACSDDEGDDTASTSTAASGASSSGAGGSGGEPTDCSNVGCAAPPLCSEGCNEFCGCCTCNDGERIPGDDGPLSCEGGCYVPLRGAGGSGGSTGSGGAGGSGGTT